MFTTILSAIAAIPTLIASIQELLAYFKKAEEQKWFEKMNEAYSKIEHPNSTDQEKDDAAKGIADSIHGS